MSVIKHVDRSGDEVEVICSEFCRWKIDRDGHRVGGSTAVHEKTPLMNQFVSKCSHKESREFVNSFRQHRKVNVKS